MSNENKKFDINNESVFIAILDKYPKLQATLRQSTLPSDVIVALGKTITTIPDSVRLAINVVWQLKHLMNDKRLLNALSAILNYIADVDDIAIYEAHKELQPLLAEVKAYHSRDQYTRDTYVAIAVLELLSYVLSEVYRSERLSKSGFDSIAYHVNAVL